MVMVSEFSNLETSACLLLLNAANHVIPSVLPTDIWLSNLRKYQLYPACTENTHFQPSQQCQAQEMDKLELGMLTVGT